MNNGTQAFIAAHGIDPFVRLRNGVQLPLSECGIFAKRLMRIFAAAVHQAPGAAAFIGIGLDDRQDIVATIFLDPDFAETDTPATAEIELDGEPAIVEFSGEPLAYPQASPVRPPTTTRSA